MKNVTTSGRGQGLRDAEVLVQKFRQRQGSQAESAFQGGRRSRLIARRRAHRTDVLTVKPGMQRQGTGSVGAGQYLSMAGLTREISPKPTGSWSEYSPPLGEGDEDEWLNATY